MVFVMSLDGKRIHAVAQMLGWNTDLAEGGSEENEEDMRIRNRVVHTDQFNNKGIDRVFEDYYRGTTGVNNRSTEEESKKFWKWEDISEEWISCCIRVFIIFIATAAAVGCQTMPLKDDRWFMLNVMVVVLLVIFALGDLLTSKSVDKIEGDAVFDVQDNPCRINIDGASSYVQEGSYIALDNANVDSILQRTGTMNEVNEVALGPVLDMTLVPKEYR